MKLRGIPESVPEAIAVALNLMPMPLLHTWLAFIAARSIMVASALGIFDVLGEADRTAEEWRQTAVQICALRSSCSTVSLASATRAGVMGSTASTGVTANGCSVPAQTRWWANWVFCQPNGTWSRGCRASSRAENPSKCMTPCRASNGLFIRMPCMS